MSFKRALGLGFAILAAAVVLIFSGLLDRLSPSGFVNHGVALFVVVLYLGIALLVFWVVTSFGRHRSQILLAFGGVAVALLGAELGLRYFHPAGAKMLYKFIYSPEFHHANLRGKELIFEAMPLAPSNLEKEGGSVFTNEIGLRSLHTREAFINYPRRVVLLGDSFTFGLYVPQSNAFPQVLEKRWQERLGNQAVAVLNAGVVSYSPFLERLLYEKELAAWQPQVVLLVLDATDVADDIQYARQARQGPNGEIFFPQKGFLKLLAAGDSWTDHCALCQRFFLPFSFLKGFLFHPVVMSTETIGPSAIRIEVDGQEESNNFFIYRHPLATTGPYFEAMLANIRAIADLVHHDGGQFLLVVPPRFQHWNLKECPNNWEGGQYRLDEPYQNEMFRFFEEKRSSVDFPILNLLPAFKATREFPLVFEDDPHWNSAGHRFVAGEVDAELVRLGWIPGPAGSVSAAPPPAAEPAAAAQAGQR